MSMALKQRIEARAQRVTGRRVSTQTSKPNSVKTDMGVIAKGKSAHLMSSSLNPLVVP